MNLDYKFGVIIDGNFHHIQINEAITEFVDIDPPYVGHLQQSRKVSFSQYSNGQLVIVSKGWKVQETKKVGEIPDYLLQEIMKKTTRSAHFDNSTI